MLGTRPLTTKDIALLEMCFQKPREKLFFRLCLVTGFRPSEALSLRVRDVVATDRVLLQKRNTKGRIKSRSILLHPGLRAYIAEYVVLEGLTAEEPLFKSREGGGPVSYTQMWRSFKQAVDRAGLTGKVACHSMRKTYARHMYEQFQKDIVKTAKALGHTQIQSTVSYLSFDTAEIDRAVVAMPWPGFR